LGKLADILIKIRADSSEALRETQKVRAAFTSLGRDAQNAGQAVALGLGAPLVALGGASVKAFADIDSLKRGLVAVTNSSAEAEKQFSSLREVAKLPGLGLPEAIKGAINLQAVGYSAGEAERMLRVFGNAIATVGGGREELAGIIVQLQQMGSKAKVTAEDLKPMINNLPMIGKALKDLYGTVDTEQLQKMGIGPQKLIADLMRELEKIPAFAGGLKNEMENVKDSFTITFAEIGKTLEGPMSSALKTVSEGLQSVAEFAKEHPTVTKMGFAIGALAASAAGAVFVFGVLADKGAALYAAMLRLLPLIGGATGGLIGIGLAALAAGAIYAYQSWSDLDQKMAEAEGGGAWAPLKDATKWTREMGTAMGDLGVKVSRDVAPAVKTTSEELAKMTKVFWETHDRYEQAVKDVESYVEVNRQLKAANIELQISERVLAETFANASEAMGNASKKQVAIMGMRLDQASVWREMARAQQQAVDGATELAAKVQDTIALSDKLPPILQREADGYENIVRAAEQQGQAQFKVNKGMQEISTVLTNMNQNIADAIINWKGFGDTAVSIAKSVGKAILSQIVGSLMETTKLIPRVMSGLGGIFNAVGLGGVMGTAGRTATSAASAASGAGSAASAASGIAGAAGQAAGAGLSATMGMVTGAISAVSGIIGNFQFMAMNKSLDLIEKETRYSQIHLLHLLEKANQYWPWMEHAHSRLVQMVNNGLGVFNQPGDAGLRIVGAAAGDSGTTVNISLSGANLLTSRAMDDFIDEMVTRMRQRGIRF